MNIFVAVVLKNPDVAVGADALTRFLPRAPLEQAHWHDGRVHLFAFAVGYPPPRDLIQQRDGWASVYDGVLLPETSEGDWPLGHLRTLPDPSRLAAAGEHALVWSDGASLYTRSNLGGTHNLYVAEGHEVVGVSNRSVCLLGLPGISHDLDPVAVKWKAFQGYVGGTGTAFAAVRKLPPGATTTISAGATHIDVPRYETLADESIRDAFASNPRVVIDEEIDRIAAYMKAAHAFAGSPPIDVALSGGKDSRVILGLALRGGLREDIATIWTRGPLYSPEVLAAQDICEAIGYPEHVVRRPDPLAASAFSAGMIVRVLNLHEGMLSLYDFCGIEPRTTFRFQGHELGLRAGRFAEVPTTTFEEFLTGALQTWSNPLRTVRSPEELTDELSRFFVSQHEAGAPVEDLGDLFSLFDRLPNWAAVISASDYCSGPISNPLLEGGVFRLVFNVPSQVRRNEAFHYLALLRSAPALLRVRFSEQKWPSGLMDVLSGLGLDDGMATPSPYRSRPYFPNVGNPYITNVKLECLQAVRPLVTDLARKHRDHFDPLFDVDGFTEALEGMSSPDFQTLYTAMGVCSAVLLQEYGDAVFDRTAHAALIEELSQRLAVSPSESAPEAGWPDLLERHERAMAELMREAQGPGAVAPVPPPPSSSAVRGLVRRGRALLRAARRRRG